MYASLMADLIGIDAPPLGCIALAGRHGFTGIDLRINRQSAQIETAGISTIRDAMHAAQVKPGYCSLLPHNLSVDEDTWNQTMRDLPKLAGFAQALGYTRTSTVILPFHETLPFDAAFALHVARVREAMNVLTDFDLRLGLEYVSPITRRAGRPFAFVHNLRGALELFKACDVPNVGLMLDTFHWHCAGETREDLLPLTAEQIVVVHVNDTPRKPVEQQVVTERELPGETGVIDLTTFMDTLRTIGYDGPITAEPTHARWLTADANAACGKTATAIRSFLEARC